MGDPSSFHTLGRAKLALAQAVCPHHPGLQLEVALHTGHFSSSGLSLSEAGLRQPGHSNPYPLSDRLVTLGSGVVVDTEGSVVTQGPLCVEWTYVHRAEADHQKC